MKYFKLFYMVFVGIFLFAGCGEKKVEVEPINESVHVCEVCKMQVKDEAYSTQLTTKNGQNYKFDDIGCMNVWKKENGTENIVKQWVRDNKDLNWVEYSQASYVYDASFRTPMCYGIVSFKHKTSAEDYAKKQRRGTVMTAKDLEKHHWKQTFPKKINK